MPCFTALCRRVDHADAVSWPIEADDLDVAISVAISQCPDSEYVAGVWQTDTPASLIAWHSLRQEAAAEVGVELPLHEATGDETPARVTITPEARELAATIAAEDAERRAALQPAAGEAVCNCNALENVTHAMGSIGCAYEEASVPPVVTYPRSSEAPA